MMMKPTILAVDDDTDILELVVETLREAEYRVVAASTAPAALKALAEEPVINLLLTDARMPVMGGRELAEAARKVQPAIRVVCMSGYNQENVVCGHFLRKPFRMIEVIRVVGDLLGAD